MTLTLEEEIIRHAQNNPQPLPTLNLILDRFLLTLPLAFKSELALLPEVTEMSRDERRCDVAVESLPSPSFILTGKAEPWTGRVAVVVEPDLLFSVLEIMLGGGNRTPSEWKPRNFTAIERSLGQRVAELALSVLEAAFSPAIETTFVPGFAETTPKALMLAQPSTPSMSIRMRITFEERSGHLTLILPHGAFGEVRNLLAAPYHGGTLEEDGKRGWDGEMGQSLAGADLTLTAVLTHFRVSLADLLDWSVGDVVDLGVTTSEPILGKVNGTPALKGRFGHRANGALALRVTEKLILSGEAIGHGSNSD